MISVVCVFNDEKVLESRLLRGLRRQSVSYDLSLIDNRRSVYASAAAALNEGAKETKGDWIVFAHQDVEFLSPDCLAQAEQILDEHRPRGWIGTAGVTAGGGFRSCMINRAHLIGCPFPGLEEVQTLDECVLIHQNGGAGYAYFDEGLAGWHAYGVEACCRSLLSGSKNYVLPIPVWHDTKSSNWAGLKEAHDYVWAKHGERLKKISTTTATLPDSYSEGDWKPSPNPPLLARGIGKLLMKAGYTVFGDAFLYGALEHLTSDSPVVEVLHQTFPIEGVEARGFVEIPKNRRRIIHHFHGLEGGMAATGHLVIMPGLIPELTSNSGLFQSLLRRVDEIVLCVNVKDVWRLLRIWPALREAGLMNVANIHFNRQTRNPNISSAVIFIVVRHRIQSGVRAPEGA